MKYRLVTDGEKYAIERRHWFIWTGEDFKASESCWMPYAVALKYLNRLQPKTAKHKCAREVHEV